MRYQFIAAVAIAVAAPAVAGVTSSVFPGGDAAFLALTDNGDLERAATESRTGNGATNGTWEFAIWDMGGSGAIQDQAQMNVTNGTAVQWSVEWDGVSTLDYTVSGQTVSWSMVPGAFTDIFIRTRSAADSTVALTQMNLDGTPIADTSATNGAPANYLRIQNMGADFGAFTLSGVQTLSWTGDMPNNSALAYQIKCTNGIPAPGAATTLLAGALLTTRRRR